MSEANPVARDLVHRLNGQLLEALEGHMKALLPGKSWRPEDWIINVILLSRNIETVFAARLETSATLYKGRLYDHRDGLNPEEVGALDLPVPLDQSFSGYCVQTNNPVWVGDLNKMNTNHPLHEFYRKFEHVAVRPETRPTAEYVFPILLKIGLIQSVLGVLNMEYFGTKKSPLKNNQQIKISEAISKLLNLHGPFLLAAIDEVSRFIEAGEDGLPNPPEIEEILLELHRRVVGERTKSFREKELRNGH